MKIKTYAFRYRFYIICLLLIAISFLFCVRISGRQSFAADEMSELGFIAKSNSLEDILMYFLTVEVTNLPLFALIAAAWYRIVPWGEQWLLLLCELFTAAGIFVICVTAKNLKDEAAGYFAAALCTISSTLILRCDMEYRCYSFLFLMIAVCLYLYVKRQKTGESKGITEELKFGIAMTLLAYAHYFGPLIIVALFLSDLILLFNKRLKLKFLIPYVMSGALLTPWFLLMLKFKQKSITDFWPSPPNLGSIPGMLRFVLSNDEPVYVLSLCAMIYVVVLAVRNLREKSVKWDFHYPLIVFLWVIWFILLGVFVYSSRINIYGSIWVDKYFISIIPFMVIIMSVFMSLLTEFFTKGEPGIRQSVTAVICMFLVLYFGLGNFYHDVKEYIDVPADPYREAALYLKDTVGNGEEIPLLVPTEDGAVKGFQEFYIDHYGLGDRIRVVSWYGSEAEDIVKNADEFYVFDVRDRVAESESEAAGLLRKMTPADRQDEYKLAFYKKI